MIIAKQKHLFFILMLLFGLLSFKNRPNSFEKVVNKYRLIHSDSTLSAKLELAFHENSQHLFKQFFIDWNETVQANAEVIVGQNDTIKAVFDSYSAFFNPCDLSKLGNWEGGNALNGNSKYVAVQNKIIFSITTADNFDEFSKTGEISYLDSISNFRPPLSLIDGDVLYLIPEYKKSLNYFLGVEIAESKEPYKMNRGLPVEEIEKRYNRIRPFIPILYGHWGGYWHIETHPLVYSIIFNKDMSLAKFDFRVGYQGGEAILSKEKYGWVIKQSNVTWIE